jgi:hypothetical protein
MSCLKVGDMVSRRADYRSHRPGINALLIEGPLRDVGPYRRRGVYWCVLRADINQYDWWRADRLKVISESR